MLGHVESASNWLPVVVGVLAAPVGAVIGVVIATAHDRRQWRKEHLTDRAAALLSAMQLLVRELTTYAYDQEMVPTETDQRGGVVHPQRAEDRFYDLVSKWNAALHDLLISAPTSLVRISRKMDREIDRLLDLSSTKRQWSREDWREERRRMGELAAEFVAEARSVTGSSSLSTLENVWTWAERAPVE